MTKTKDKLIGKVWHSFDTAGTLRQQGQIESPLGDGYYLVLLFGWLVGMASAQQVVHLSDMKGWNFYDDKEYWRVEGERRLAADARRHDQGDSEASEVLPSM